MTDIKEHYRQAIHDIMSEHNVDPSEFRISHVVTANTGFAEALQHTDWYVAGRGDQDPHYRYSRYMDRLQTEPISGNRLAHVDIGCGAGLFSWVFLDWVTSKGIGHACVDLYGLDHCQAMIDIAGMVKDKLSLIIANYPDLRYYRDVDGLLSQLTKSHTTGTDYIVTFGHVLIQAHTPENLRNFARIIAHIVRPIGLGAKCSMVIVDAFSGDRPAQLEAAKKALWDNLAEMGVNKG